MDIFIATSKTDPMSMDGEQWTSVVETEQALLSHLLNEITNWCDGDYSDYPREDIVKIVNAYRNGNWQTMIETWNSISGLELVVERDTVRDPEPVSEEELQEILESLEDEEDSENDEDEEELDDSIVDPGDGPDSDE